MDRQALSRVFVLTLLLLVTSVADAKETVVVRGDRSTTTVDDAKLESLIHLELGDKAESIEAVIVELSAKSVASILITRSDGRTTKGVIDLREREGGVERTIALFVGELSREERPAADPPAPSPTPAPLPADTTTTTTTAPPAKKPAVVNSNAARLYFAAGARVVAIGQTGGNAILSTPMVGASLGIGERARIGAIARVGFASKSERLGKVSALLAGGGLDAAYRAYVSTDRSVKIDTGPRVVASWIQGEGLATTQQITTGRESSAFGLELAWFVEASMIVSRPFFLGLAMEAGWLTPGLDLRADDRKVLQITGASLGATLSIGVEFEPR